MACGACRAFAGETEFGLKLIGEGLVSQRQGGNGSWLRSTLVTAVAAHMQSGNLGRALELLTEAIAHAEKSHASVLLPEIERLHAEVLLLTGQIDTPQAIVRIEAAAAHARQQGALALEWRATMALARLYACVGRDRGTQAAARQLCGVHARVASPDLVEGKQLPDSMS